MLRRRRLVTVAALGALVAVGAAPSAGAQTRSRTSRDRVRGAQRARRPERRHRAARVPAHTTGRAFILDEALNPGDTPTPASTFTQTLRYERSAAGTRLRADNVRTSQGTARRITEVVSGPLGYLSGIDANGGQHGDRRR